MNRIFLFTLIALVTFVNVTIQQNCEVRKAFIDSRIVPDMIRKAPCNLVTVLYITSGVEANLGNELTPTQAKDQPTVCWKTQPGALYTLTLTDPDATSPEWRHWIVINVPGTNVACGETVVEYIGPAPPLGTGRHRYVFLVYKQAGGRVYWTGPKLSNRNPNRGNFSSTEFAKQNHLGKPVAGNYFLAQYDDYVPVIDASLTDTN